MEPRSAESALPTVVLPEPQGPARTTSLARLDEGGGGFVRPVVFSSFVDDIAHVASVVFAVIFRRRRCRASSATPQGDATAALAATGGTERKKRGRGRREAKEVSEGKRRDSMGRELYCWRS